MYAIWIFLLFGHGNLEPPVPDFILSPLPDLLSSFFLSVRLFISFFSSLFPSSPVVFSSYIALYTSRSTANDLLSLIPPFSRPTFSFSYLLIFPPSLFFVLVLQFPLSLSHRTFIVRSPNLFQNIKDADLLQCLRSQFRNLTRFRNRATTCLGQRQKARCCIWK